MSYFLAGVILALVYHSIAVRKRSQDAGSKLVEDVRQELRRRVENLKGEIGAELATQRRLLAEIAAGEVLSRDQVLEGRLWKDVDVREALALVESGRVHLLDVRTPQETASGILPGAQLIPVDQLEGRLAELPKDDRPTLVYCAAGGRSAAACEFLESTGRRGLLNLAGGYSSWNGPRAAASTPN